MRVFEILVDLVVGIVVIILFPIVYFNQKQDITIQQQVNNEILSFSGDVKEKGYIDKDDYEQLVERLQQLGGVYDIKLSHTHQSLEPEYRIRTPAEVIDEQNTEYTGTNERNYFDVNTELPDVYDPVYEGNVNTETNETVLADAEDKPAGPNHIHGDDCYNGTKHVHSGSSSSGGGCYTKKTTTTVYCSEPCSMTDYNYHNIKQEYLSGEWKCSAGGTHVTQLWSCTCGGGGWNVAGPLCCAGSGGGHIYDWHYYCPGHSTTTYQLNCGKTEGKYYDEHGNEVGPICDQIIVSLEATHPEQTVYLNSSLITTARATYQDGSEKTVVCITDLSTSEIVTDKTGLLIYSYELDGITYVKHCSIKITVIPNNKTCPEGHVYNLDGSNDPGCPYCREWIRTLEVYTPTSGNISIYRGTTLPENGVVLLATYYDGHTEFVYDEYIDNLDRYYVGFQLVKLSYKGKNTTLNVTTKRNIVKCPVCNNWYELYPNDEDPGCPYCIAKKPIFTNNILIYNTDNYTDQILNELYYGSGRFYFDRGDFLLVNIKTKNKGKGQAIIENMYLNTDTPYININESGYIRETGISRKTLQ